MVAQSNRFGRTAGEPRRSICIKEILMVPLFLIVLSFIFLVFIALTYDKTVTPTVKLIKNSVKDIDILRSDSRDVEKLIVSEYKLFDHAEIIVPIALCYFTYELFTSDVPFYYPGSSFIFTLWIWIMVLFKVHKIKIYEDKVIRFQGLIRNIDINASQITEVQDWLRFVRVKLRKRSLILFPFIDKLGDFKSEIRALNPESKIKDISNSFFDSKFGLIITLIGIFLFFGCMIAICLYQFTNIS